MEVRRQWKELISLRKDREKENTVSLKEWEQETEEKSWLAEEQEAELNWVRNFVKCRVDGLGALFDSKKPLAYDIFSFNYDKKHTPF